MEGTQAVSTLLSQPNPAMPWKQEVNLRLAEHKRRRGLSAVDAPAQAAPQVRASSAASLAAARVAARYAKARSFSEMVEADAQSVEPPREAAPGLQTRAAVAPVPVAATPSALVRPIEISAPPSRTAERFPEPTRAREPEPALKQAPRPVQELPAPAAFEPHVPEPVAKLEAFQRPAYELPWEPETPVAVAETAASRARRGLDDAETPVQEWWENPSRQASAAVEEIEAVELEQPIPANLIEFPRELVAARKSRPRLAEGPSAVATLPEAQLSIFEVDPFQLAAPTVSAAVQPARVEWVGLELEAQPLAEREAEAEPDKAGQGLQLAPLHRRILAVLVDGSLVAGTFLAAALMAATRVEATPGIRAVEAGAAAALLAAGLVYQALFTALGDATPGMKYAGIGLCTFDGRQPSRAQRFGRLGALLLSLMPAGLGVAWAIFDEEHLSWHDRLSKTYQRRG
jgi:uncharacterized RDD family membrane protein YckC